MAVAIDRMIKGKTVEATNALQKIAKDKARATSPSPSLGKQVSATSTTAAGAAGRLGTPTVPTQIDDKLPFALKSCTDYSHLSLCRP